ncbi:Flp pilus assembly protein CpaB [Neobacillus sp. SAB-20_R2A]|uniref:Flp pilus assembly protein CpaB n=1 Tax=Neobacillus sp. SAB-20_R2A TaxID=3120519 RepID=UPI003C6E6F1E
MKSKKLWLLSFILGLLATLAIYFVITSNVENEPASTSASVTDDTKTEEKAASSTENTTAQAASQPTANTGILPISEGKRAMSIQVPDPFGVAGYIKPGAHVDVVAKLLVPGDAKPGQYPAEKLILQNVKVLALGHAADDAETKKRYQIVTLEVAPKDGLALGFAMKYELFLMLRKDGDEKLESDPTHVYENQLQEGVFLK